MLPTAVEALSDDELVDRTREGDLDHFGELWRRHAPGITRAVRRFTGYDPEDVSAEAFARVLRQVRAGGGPEREPRAYLLRAARNVAAEWARRGTDDGVELAEEHLVGLATPDPAEREAQRDAARAAYARLPERWRQALWYREVEDLPVADCAVALGTTANTATVLLKRAREGLAQEWIREHLSRGAEGECSWVVARLPRYARGRSTPADARRITRHLAGCRACTLADGEARHLEGRLAVLLIPLVLGGGIALVRAADDAPPAEMAGDAPAVPRPVAPRLVTPRSIAIGFGGVAAAVTAVLLFAQLGPIDFGPFAVSDDGPAATAEPEAAPTDPTESDAQPAPEQDGGAAPRPPSSGTEPAAGPTVRALAVDAPPSSGPLYPLITGRATDGATVEMTFTGTGGSVVVTTTADGSGWWSLRPHTVTDWVTSVATQHYVDAAGVARSETAAENVNFGVTQGAGFAAVDSGPGESVVTLSGPAGMSVELRGLLTGVHPLDAAGTVSFTVPHMKSALAGQVEFRLVSGASTGPWATY